MYNVKLINDDTYYIGTSDRRIELFENAYPLKNGVSYNSYMIMDEKTVLIDTEDWSVGRTFMENVRHVLNGRPLDIIIDIILLTGHGRERIMPHHLPWSFVNILMQKSTDL